MSRSESFNLKILKNSREQIRRKEIRGEEKRREEKRGEERASNGGNRGFTAGRGSDKRGAGKIERKKRK